MAEPEIVAALAEALEAFRRGEAELEACLERHAAHRAELEALLEVVQLIPFLASEIRPGDRFRERTRRILQEHAGGGAGGPNGWRWQHPRFP